MTTGTSARLLRQLASSYGVLTAYYDIAHRRRHPSPDALLAVLRSLGAPVAGLRDVPSALRQRRQNLWQRPLEPVVIAWDGALPTVEVRLSDGAQDGPLHGHLTLETGDRRRLAWHGADLPVLASTEVEGVRYAQKRLPLPSHLPWGYHRLTLEVRGKLEEATVIAAPVTAHAPPESTQERTWGVFLPLYALSTERSWGTGDLSDLESFMEWVFSLGGGIVSTLPLLAAFLDNPCDPSPYAPASRLLWNELFLDVTRIPELRQCARAQAVLQSPSLQQELEALRRLPLLDYRRVMALKRSVLGELARWCQLDSPDQLAALHQFADAHPVVDDYARFRATCAKQHAPWCLWPQRLRDGVLKAGDYDEETRLYHLYVQWLARQQMDALAQKGREHSVGLSLDLPLGVHPDGYDVWRYQGIFTRGVSVGAPPDGFFIRGQDWGFPPLHPEGLREQGYGYYTACLRHHLRHASLLRIDHVMGLHRQFWVPHGMKATDGVYVRYHSDDFYAILALESRRHGAMIVGEDLGTVPPAVRPAMRKHGLHRMYVGQFELSPDPGQAIRPVFPGAVASVNTHDTPTFGAFWRGLDIQDREDLGLLDEAQARHEHWYRQTLRLALAAFLRGRGHPVGVPFEQTDALQGLLAFLAASPARALLVNLEDLWGETRPQNVPGTTTERPNWQRRARLSFQEFSQMPQVVDTLRRVGHLRREAGGQ